MHLNDLMNCYFLTLYDHHDQDICFKTFCALHPPNKSFLQMKIVVQKNTCIMISGMLFFLPT